MPGNGSPVLALVGDVMLARRVANRETEGIWEVVRGADIAFANLEVPLTDRGHPADKAIVLRSPPALAGELSRLGFGVVSIANNHALDFGVEGLLQTLDVVRQAGVAVVGGGRNVEEALAPALLTRQGVTVAFLGMACTLPPGYAATAGRPGIAPVRVLSQFVIDAVSIDEQPGMSPYVRSWALPEDVTRACRAVAAARERADVVVVGIHWGVPLGWVAQFQDVLAEYQRPLGRALVEAGADLVVGHHPHCLHGIEACGRGWILYSVGNFLFHSLAGSGDLVLARTYPPYRLDSLMGREAREGALVSVRVSRRGVEELEIIPTVMNDDGGPVQLTGEEAQAVLERVDRHSRPLGVAVEAVGDRGRVVRQDV